jgi:hypothetical protein
VSAILRTWPSVLKSRYSYMGRLVPRLLADGIHRASAALSEQAALHEEEEEDKDDKDDKGKGKDGRDKDRDRDDNKRRRVEAKRPEARYFQVRTRLSHAPVFFLGFRFGSMATCPVSNRRACVYGGIACV